MSFGQSASLYNSIRQPYQDEAMQQVAVLLGTKTSKVLDLGCGTGIATRQLASFGYTVTGTDIDEDMIKHARLNNPLQDYFVMPATRLEFADESFDGATAFGAFHWFCDEASTQEIKRVLKPNTVLVVVNKNDTSDFRKQIIAIVSRYQDLNFAQAKANYNPAALLSANGFKDVAENIFPSAEYFSPDEAVAHARTMKLWQEIPETLYAAVENDLRTYVHDRLNSDGYFSRTIETKIISGHR